LKTLILGSSGQKGSYLGPIVRKSEYEVVGASRNLAGDNTSVSVRALSEILKLGSTGSCVTGSDALHTVEDFFLADCDLIGIPNGLDFAYQDSILVRKVENDALIADTTKVRAELQWRPKFQFREIVFEILKSKCEREGIDFSL